MRVLPSPKEAIGEAVLQLWRTTPVLKDRFPDTDDGTIRFITFCTEAVQRQLEHERMG